MSSPNITFAATAASSGFVTVDLEETTIVALLLMALVILLILVLNPICLVALRRASAMHDSTKILMASLTISDLCTGVLCAVPQITEDISQRWILGDFLCLMWGIAYPSTIILSVTSLLLLTIDRFIAIVHPLRHPCIMTSLSSKVIVGVTWTSAYLTNVVLYGVYFQATASKRTYYRCNYSDVEVYIYSSICTLAFPLVIILVLYLYILRVAQRQARRIADQNHATSEEQNAGRRLSTKSATTVFIVTGTVFICWTPALILLLLFITQQITFHPSMSIAAKAVLFSNSWLNVIIYYWRNAELRQAIRGVISCICRHLC
ncbi:beta-1 adrenergic receptor-like [Patiria miniata]|uniref:G-protein coupled receptors family 1 profile domain-containing protein n=1 Tax=Patiria miniata TaxID=46514 RepID=A0A914A6K5_PATMI|nr:beta-1 adrenergic receptor-like [Patiria miniata]